MDASGESDWSEWRTFNIIAECDVGDLTPVSVSDQLYPPLYPGVTAQLFDAAAHADPNHPLIDTEHLDPTLKMRLNDFQRRVSEKARRLRRTVTVVPQSGFRPTAYQAHLYELKTKFRDLLQLDGVKATVVKKGKFCRPQLKITKQISASCERLVSKVNDEIDTHRLTPRRDDGTPSVCPPGTSRHEEGRAIDISITGLSEKLLTRLAEESGLLKIKTHYQLRSDPPDPCG